MGPEKNKKMKQIYLASALLGLLVSIGAGGLIAFSVTKSSQIKDRSSKSSDLVDLKEPEFQLSNRMVWISGGDFWMGDDKDSYDDAKPIHKVHVDGFWMDQYTVTNAEFAEFVEQTGYVTVAERKLNPEEYPNVPTEMLQPGAVVFIPPTKKVEGSSGNTVWWKWVKGASWRHPDGPQSDLRGKEKYPVVQVAYEDAKAYADWKGARLPTEAEWEYAARGGLERKIYPWGDDLKPQGKYMANTWQGEFPEQNTSEDGFAGLAPVGSFPPNNYGLFHMVGNVWQWTSDWYRADYYQSLAKQKIVSNPQGPEESYDPLEPEVKKKVQRGGSFLCSEDQCGLYRVGSRGKGDIMSGSPQLGFRLVHDDATMAKADGKTLSQ